jgi:hypothetical protein
MLGGDEVDVNPLSFKPNPANLAAAAAPREEDGVYRISRVNQKVLYLLKSQHEGMRELTQHRKKYKLE